MAALLSSLKTAVVIILVIDPAGNDFLGFGFCRVAISCNSPMVIQRFA
jgi:hypothetical protein